MGFTISLIWLQLILFLAGAGIASFINVVLSRGWRQSLKGRSHCDHCHKTLPPQYLIPFFSSLYLLTASKGKSACCGQKLNLWRYLLAEALGGIWSLGLFWNLYDQAWLNILLFSIPSLIFLYLAIDDIWHLGIDSLVLGLFGLSVLLMGIIAPTSWQAITGHLVLSWESLQTVAVVGAIISLLMLISRGKGLGLGDLLLVAVMAFGLGGWGTLVAMQLTIYLAACFGIIYAWRVGKFKGQIIPLVPFLLLGWLLAPLLAGPLLNYFGADVLLV